MAYTTDLIPQMTSNNSPAGIVTPSSTYGNRYAWLVFDDDLGGAGTEWLSGSGDIQGWLEYEFINPQVINKYTIGCPSGGNQVNRMITEWNFEAWDGSSWVVLDSRSSETGWSDLEVREYTFTNSVSYSKYRINIFDNNGDANYSNIGQVEMMYDLSLISWSIDQCTGGVATAKGTNYGSPDNVFDDNVSTRWGHTDSSYPTWIQYEFNEPKKITRFRLYSYNTSGWEAVKDFSILASNTGSFSGEETLIYTGTHPGDKLTEFIDYTFPNTNSYTYYRMNIDSCYPGNGGNNNGIHEIEMMEENIGTVIDVTGVSLNTNSLNFVNGDSSSTLTANVSPIDATNQDVDWTITDDTIASIIETSEGVLEVTPLNGGSTTITVTTVDGGYTDTCTVDVQSVTDISLDKSSITFKEDSTAETITATITPSDAFNQNINWSITDDTIASITETSEDIVEITPLISGHTTVTATSEDGNYTASLDVYVMYETNINLPVDFDIPLIEEESKFISDFSVKLHAQNQLNVEFDIPLIENTDKFKGIFSVSYEVIDKFIAEFNVNPFNSMEGQVDIIGMDIKKISNIFKVRRNEVDKILTDLDVPKTDVTTKMPVNFNVRHDVENKFSGLFSVPPSNSLTGEIDILDSPERSYYATLIKDTYTMSSQPDRNFGLDSKIYLSDEHTAFLQYNFDTIDDIFFKPENELISYLDIYIERAYHNPTQLSVYSTSNEWSEYYITENNKPGITHIGDIDLPLNYVGWVQIPLGDLISGYDKENESITQSLAVTINSDRYTKSPSKEGISYLAPKMYYKYYYYPPNQVNISLNVDFNVMCSNIDKIYGEFNVDSNWAEDILNVDFDIPGYNIEKKIPVDFSVINTPQTLPRIETDFDIPTFDIEDKIAVDFSVRYDAEDKILNEFNIPKFDIENKIPVDFNVRYDSEEKILNEFNIPTFNKTDKILNDFDVRVDEIDRILTDFDIPKFDIEEKILNDFDVKINTENKILTNFNIPTFDIEDKIPVDFSVRYDAEDKILNEFNIPKFDIEDKISIDFNVKYNVEEKILTDFNIPIFNDEKLLSIDFNIRYDSEEKILNEFNIPTFDVEDKFINDFDVPRFDIEKKLFSIFRVIYVIQHNIELDFNIPSFEEEIKFINDFNVLELEINTIPVDFNVRYDAEDKILNEFNIPKFDIEDKMPVDFNVRYDAEDKILNEFNIPKFDIEDKMPVDFTVRRDVEDKIFTEISVPRFDDERKIIGEIGVLELKIEKTINEFNVPRFDEVTQFSNTFTVRVDKIDLLPIDFDIPKFDVTKKIPNDFTVRIDTENNLPIEFDIPLFSDEKKISLEFGVLDLEIINLPVEFNIPQFNGEGKFRGLLRVKKDGENDLEVEFNVPLFEGEYKTFNIFGVKKQVVDKLQCVIRVRIPGEGSKAYAFIM